MSELIYVWRSLVKIENQFEKKKKKKEEEKKETKERLFDN